MTVSVYVLVAAGLALALLAAALLPPPARPAEEDAGIGLGLLAAGCVTALVMGVLALLGLPVATACLGAVAWLLVMPCVWLARAPRPLEEGWDPQIEDDDDDGGDSPSPRGPDAPAAGDEEQAGAQAPAPAPGRVGWTPAPQPVPVMATAAKVRLMLAAEQAQRQLAMQEVDRRIVVPVQLPPREVPAAPAAQPAAPLHAPEWPRLQPAPRVRDDHGCVAHASAVDAQPRRRWAARRRTQRPALHD